MLCFTGVDGSLFLAHTINFGDEKGEFDESLTSSSSLHSKQSSVNGVQLQWGAKGELDRESCLGSVTCVAASKGSGYRLGGGTDKISSKSSIDQSCADEEEIISSMEGCQVIAGTTGGGLRVWSLKDVYLASHIKESAQSTGVSSSMNRSHHGSGSTSVRPSAGEFGMQDAMAGASIGGHRGGVTCIDLPPRMYRPDSLVSGGEDGLIKLWSLKSTSQITSIRDYDASDAKSVLTGHEGKIICIKTAWHGDKVLSGGADRTVRLWDLSGSGGKPLITLQGHTGLVTQINFFGPNTICSASTDRSIQIWDTRAGSRTLFALRYHLAPVSDLLVGDRSEPVMVSAGADCSLATWDFRMLSGARAEISGDEHPASNQTQSSRTIRLPMSSMNHNSHSKSPMNLVRSVGRDEFSFFSISDDGVVNEWEAASGRKVSSYQSGHRDAISGFYSFSSSDELRQEQGVNVSRVGGTISCSWDGTVRLRRLSRKRVD